MPSRAVLLEQPNLSAVPDDQVVRSVLLPHGFERESRGPMLPFCCFLRVPLSAQTVRSELHRHSEVVTTKIKILNFSLVAARPPVRDSALQNQSSLFRMQAQGRMVNYSNVSDLLLTARLRSTACPHGMKTTGS